MQPICLAKGDFITAAVINEPDIAHKPNTDVIKAATANLSSDGAVSDKISTTIAGLVKGKQVGTSEDAQAQLAESLFRGSITKSNTDPSAVINKLSPQFSTSLGKAATMSNRGMQSFMANLNAQLSAELGKNITIGGSFPVAGGLVPYDLSAPAKLIYPVYSPFRNMIPRTQGQGKTHEAKVITAISGSSIAGVSSRMGIPEVPAGNMTSWNNNIPAAGTQTGASLSIPYKFFGLSESVSWLAQFSGQGFEDAAGLASLILLQEMMMLEERAIISGTTVTLPTPAAPGFFARAAGTGETGLTNALANVFVRVTALDFFGETVASAANSTTAWVAGQVIDVTIAPVPGATSYNVYVSTSATTEPAAASRFLQFNTGATKVTLQGTLVTSGTNAPTADTTSGSALDYEGLISTISGRAAANGVYPAGYQGSYVNQSVNQVLKGSVLDAALYGMWNGPNGIFADPDDLWCEGSDITRLSQDISNSSTSNYKFNIAQSEMGSVQAGVAVRQYTNPVTQKVLNLKVHPFIPQGTALLLSWKLPNPWSNVSNVWENVMVQDYLSISWPVIDATFRYSMFMYGCLFTPAVQYNGLLQGLNRSATAPF